MDFRKIFNDRVEPEIFDKFRFRYCSELFADVIAHAHLDAAKSALEIGPGTGQATEPILKTGCAYTGVELSESFAEDMRKKFGGYGNFSIINADFETCPLASNSFDLVYSAATIQWIDETVAFPRAYDILKSGGTLAMFMTHTDNKSSNESLYEKIQSMYDSYYKPEQKYNRKFIYANAVNYGFRDFERREYKQVIKCTADEYVSYISIYADHLTVPEPYRTRFFDGVRDAINGFGGCITMNNTIVLYLTRKP